MRDDYVGTGTVVASVAGVILFAVAMGYAVDNVAHHPHPVAAPAATKAVAKATPTASHVTTPPPHAVTTRHAPAAAPVVTTAVDAVRAMSTDADTIATQVRSPVRKAAVLKTTCTSLKNLVVPAMPAGSNAAAVARLRAILLDDVAVQTTCQAAIADATANPATDPQATTDSQHVGQAIAVLRADIALFSSDIAR